MLISAVAWLFFVLPATVQFLRRRSTLGLLSIVYPFIYILSIHALRLSPEIALTTGVILNALLLIQCFKQHASPVQRLGCAEHYLLGEA
jgi:hypothetical protein